MWLIRDVDTPADTPLPDDVEQLKAALLAERAIRREVEARVADAQAMIEHLKLRIAMFEQHRFGASSERGRKILDQLELQLEELETEIAEAKARAATGEGEQTTVRAFTRAKPVRKPFPDHLPRERVVLPGPTACPCCGGKLVKLGETSTETLESIPRTYKVIQTVREKFACRSCESITEPPAPFHPIPRGRAGAHLLADILHGKFCEHQPLNRQSESFHAGRLGGRLHHRADAAHHADRGACARGRAHPWRRHHGAGVGQGKDHHRSAVDLCAR